jgi:hypothetical protein
MRLPSRLPYSPLLRDCDGADRVSEDPGRTVVAEGRLAGRLAAGRRDLGVVVLGRDEVDFGLADSGFCPGEEVPIAEPCMPAEPDELAAPDLPAGLDARDAVRELGRVDADLGLAAGLRAAVVRDVVVVRRFAAGLAAAGFAAGLAAAGFAADIVLAAAVRAFAAVDIALVAVFIARMADDIVLADAFALVAAAVILVAADVTLVAADDTVLAAPAGVAEVRLVVVRRAAVVRLEAARVPALRLVVPRLVVLLRAAVVREPVERDAVDRDAEPRVDLEVVLLDDFPAVPAADFALGELLDDLELDVDCGRLAVPLDALRLTDLLRAVLAELRRVAARVVD